MESFAPGRASGVVGPDGSAVSPERLHTRRYVGPRKPPGQNLLELTAGFAPGLGEQRFRVVFVQTRSEQEQTRQLNRSAAQLVEHARKLRRKPCHPDPLECRIFGVSEPLEAVSVERRAGLFEVEPPAIDFDEMFDDVGDSAMFNSERAPAFG